jgi:hypothetical protein
MPLGRLLSNRILLALANSIGLVADSKTQSVSDCGAGEIKSGSDLSATQRISSVHCSLSDSDGAKQRQPSGHGWTDRSTEHDTLASAATTATAKMVDVLMINGLCEVCRARTVMEIGGLAPCSNRINLGLPIGFSRMFY